jgi:hypothetical protein
MFHNEKILEIKPIEYKGPVYNFTVEEDESYTANSIIVHNCRCVVIFTTSELTGLADDEADDNDEDTSDE